MAVHHPVNSVSATGFLDSLGISGGSSSPVDVDLRALFESRRPIRELIPNGQSATIPMRTLNSELTCPVCLGIIQSCTAVMECLHRFCSQCIEKSLRFGKKECPSCRVGCASRRNLRKDAAFDAVIKAIYPDISKAEASQDTYIREVIESYNVRKFGEIATKGARQQKDQARRSAKRPASPPPSHGGMSYSSQLPLSKRPRNPNKPEPISFSIVQHPMLSQSQQYGSTFLLPNKFVRTSRYITVLLLKKWLQLKLITDKERTRKEALAQTNTTTNDTNANATEGANGEEEKKESTDATAAPAAAPANTDGDEKMADSTPVASEPAVAAADAAAAAPAPAAAAASSSTTVDGDAAASPAADAGPVIPPVRFVLYVRAFDLSLLAGSDALVGVEPPGEETFVPLASDLTLDYIEEHMWNSEGARAANTTMQLNTQLQSLAPDEDAAPVLKESFKQSYVRCGSHRKAKQPCPEDCAERVAAWTEYLARESEKVKQWRAATEMARQAATETAAANAAQAAANGLLVDEVMNAAAAIAATPMPPPVLQPPPTKKRRLVIYYSVVGADGQILLDQPSLDPAIVQKYVIPEPVEVEDTQMDYM